MPVLINFLKQSWLVMLAALLFGLLVSGLYGQLEPKIKEQARLKLENEMGKLLTEATAFESIPDAENPQYFIGKNDEGAVVGYAIQWEGGGFADKIKLLVALDRPLEKLLGIGILKTNETPGFGDKIKGDKFKGQYKGSPALKLKVEKEGDRSNSDDQNIIAITGATISSDAVTKIVNNAVIELKKLLGDS
ncbi:MAG: FMN-binding protein [Planctomycetes bacterium]|nr:FMN-binding protein [Planctomycetota bacterium]